MKKIVKGSTLLSSVFAESAPESPIIELQAFPNFFNVRSVMLICDNKANTIEVNCTDSLSGGADRK